MLLKKYLRMLPMAIVTLLIAMYMNDFNAFKYSPFYLLLFPPQADLPAACIVQWSNRVDLVCSAFVFIAFHCLLHLNLLNVTGGILAIVISLIPKLWRYLTFKPLLSYVMVRSSGRFEEIYVPSFFQEGRHEYYNNTLFPGSFNASKLVNLGPILQNVMANEYLVFHQRMTPFFVGMTLAIALHRTYFPSAANEKQKKENQEGFVSSLLQVIYFLLSILTIFQPILLGWKSASNGFLEPKDLVPEPPLVLDLIVSVFNRSIYASGWAYLIYRMSLPNDHKLKLNSWAKWFENSWFLQTIAPYSYAIYLLHMNVIILVMWKWLPPAVMDRYIPEEQVFLRYLTFFGIHSVIIVFLAMLCHHLVERPIFKYLSIFLAKIHNFLLPDVNSDKKKE